MIHTRATKVSMLWIGLGGLVDGSVGRRRTLGAGLMPEAVVAHLGAALVCSGVSCALTLDQSPLG